MTSVNVGGIYYTVSMDTADLLRGSRTATKELSIMESRLNDVAVAAKAVVSGMAVMNIIDIADEWGQYASRLKMATQSTDEYNIVQERMIQSANMTFRSINETKESFIQMSPVLRQMGYDLGESMDAIETFSGLLVVNGASAERGAAAMQALSVSLQKGKIDADSWMTIYSTMDSIVDVISASSGKAAAEIRQLGVNGKLSVREFTEALANGYLPTMQKVAEMPTSVRDAMQNLTNGFQEYIGKANEAAGITATIAKGLSLLGDNFSMVAEVGLAAAGGAMLSYTGAAVKVVAASLKARQASIEVARAAVAEAAATARRTQAEVIAAKHQMMAAKTAQEQAAALSVLRQAKLADVQATKVQEAANNSLAKSQALMRGAGTGLLGIMGGPAGLAVTVGLAAAAFLALRERGEQARKTLEEMQGPLEEVASSFRRMSQDQQAQKLVEYTEAHADAVRNAANAYKELEQSIVLDLEHSRPDFAFSGQMDEYLKKLRDAKSEGQALTPVLQEMAKAANLNPDYIAGWTKLAGEFNKSAENAGIASAALVAVNNIFSMLKHSANDAAAGVNNANAAMGLIGDAAQKQIDTLQKQITLFGKTGSAASVLYDIEQARLHQKGQFAQHSTEELDAIEKEARALAKLEASKNRGGGGPSKAQQSAEKRKRELEQIAEVAKRYIDTLQQQYDQVDKMTNLERLEYEIKAKKVTLGDEEYKTAVNLAEKLDERARKERELVEVKKAAAEALNVQNAELSAQRQLLSEIAGYDADIDGAGMGERARSEMEARLQIVQQFAQRVQQIDDQRRQALAQTDEKDRERISQMYDDVLSIEQDYQGKSLAAYDQYVQRKREADADWTTGATRAWANYVEQAQEAASLADQAISSWLSSTEDALVNFVQTGKLSFSDLASSIIADLARIAAKQMITGLLGNVFGGMFDGASSISGLSSGTGLSSTGGGGYSLSSGTSGLGLSVAGGRANGGPVAAGQMYEVNERGTPELLTYGGKQYLMMGNQSGNVTPMGSGGGGMQQHGGNVIVNVHGAPSQPQVQERTDSGGNRVIDVLFGQFEQRLGQRMAAGQGAAFQGLNSRVVLQPRR